MMGLDADAFDKILQLVLAVTVVAWLVVMGAIIISGIVVSVRRLRRE